jgi:hypothetical protein
MSYSFDHPSSKEQLSNWLDGIVNDFGEIKEENIRARSGKGEKS